MGFYGLAPMHCHPNAVAVQLHSQKRALLTDFCIEWHTERLVR